MNKFTFKKSYLKLFMFSILIMFSLSIGYAADDAFNDALNEETVIENPAFDALPSYESDEKDIRPITSDDPKTNSFNPDDVTIPDLRDDKKTKPLTTTRPNLEAYSNVGAFSFPQSLSAAGCSASGSGFLSGSALGPLAMPFEMLMKLLSNELSVYILLFIFFFMMMYGIIHAALTKVKVFDEAKRQGKIVAVSMAMIINLSFFGITSRYGGPKAVLTRFLSTFELFGGMILATIMFLIIYYGFRQKEDRSWKLAMGGAGLALLLVGSIICAPTWTSIGFFIIFLSLLIGGLMSPGIFGGGSGDTGEGTGPGGEGSEGASGGGSPGVVTPHQVQNFQGRYNP